MTIGVLASASMKVTIALLGVVFFVASYGVVQMDTGDVVEALGIGGMIVSGVVPVGMIWGIMFP